MEYRYSNREYNEMCPPPDCGRDCGTCAGFRLIEKPRPKFEPTPIELTPRSSCINSMPVMARECTHTPRCVPPSSHFPYYLPCYWPARPSAPCTEPAHCYHNPPCLPRRKPRVKMTNPDISCKPARLGAPSKDSGCTNILCLGKNEEFKSMFNKKYGVGKVK